MLSVICGVTGLWGDRLWCRPICALGELLLGLKPLGECRNIFSNFSGVGGFGFAVIPSCPGFLMGMRCVSAFWFRAGVSFCATVLYMSIVFICCEGL